MAEMNRLWEYKVERISNAVNDAEDYLNGLGSEGWELMGKLKHAWIFKRLSVNEGLSVSDI